MRGVEFHSKYVLQACVSAVYRRGTLRFKRERVIRIFASWEVDVTSCGTLRIVWLFTIVGGSWKRSKDSWFSCSCRRTWAHAFSSSAGDWHVDVVWTILSVAVSELGIFRSASDIWRLDDSRSRSGKNMDHVPRRPWPDKEHRLTILAKTCVKWAIVSRKRNKLTLIEADMAWRTAFLTSGGKYFMAL